MLDGDRMAKSMYKIKFRENLDTVLLCTGELNKGQIKRLQSAIDNFYHFDHFESEEIGKYKKKTIKIIDIKTVMMTKMSMANDVNVK